MNQLLHNKEVERIKMEKDLKNKLTNLEFEIAEK